MRFAKVTSAFALVLFVSGAAGILGGWAVSTACVLALISAGVAAIAMEERDLTGTAALMTADPADPTDLGAPANTRERDAA